MNFPNDFDKKWMMNMGGIGSGRHRPLGAKDTTSNYFSIDVRRWHRKGLLELNRSFAFHWLSGGVEVDSIQVDCERNRVILSHRHYVGCEEWKEKTYPVYLDWTDCHLGGQRPWFLCPKSGCGRRAAILYVGSIFACRHCHQLVYRSQHENHSDRAIRQVERIREKLGWQPGIFNGAGMKPKGMHWATFHRLNSEHERLAQILIPQMEARLAQLWESLDDWNDLLY